MKKLCAISCIVFLIVCSTAFALQAEIEPSDYILNKETVSLNGATISEYRSYLQYDATLHLDKGWNLVMAGTDFFDEYVLPGSELKMDDLETVFGFFPTSKQYVPLHPQPDEKQKTELMKIISSLKAEERDEIKTTAKWIFAKRPGTLKMEFNGYYDVFALWKGWNLIALNTFLEDSSLSDHKGNCKILNAYEFKNNSWIEWDISKTIEKTDIGKGLAIKTGNDCVMYELEEKLTPPALPED
ncbi:hypothetical protein KY340_01210 [Candidatus Woesearchaeota archaeon]|nr:hypothetical protein [Candidatus Woesearchaeota archaeon]